jgi:hypothetical protein
MRGTAYRARDRFQLSTGFKARDRIGEISIVRRRGAVLLRRDDRDRERTLMAHDSLVANAIAGDEGGAVIKAIARGAALGS